MPRPSLKAIECDRPKPPFGSIETRYGGKTYRAAWRVKGEKQTATFDTYAEAYFFLTDMGKTVHEGGRATNIRKTRTPWGQVAWQWYNDRHPNDPVGRVDREYYALKKFEGMFGNVPIAEITRRDIQLWINHLAEDPAHDCGDCEQEQADAADDEARCAFHRKRGNKPTAAKTIGDYYGVISQVMRLAHLDGYFGTNVMCPIGKGLHDLPTVDRREVFLTMDEMAYLLAVCAEKYPAHHALVHLIAHTGLRAGEAFGLTRERYNAIGEHLLIRQSLHKRTRTLKTTKTTRWRRVDLFECCVPVLNEYLAGHESEIVFPDRSGNFIGADNWRNRVWDPLVEAAGFENLGLHLHDLRHSHVTHLLVDLGWEDQTVAERVGHSSVKMTKDVYGHSVPGRQRELVKRGIRAVV